MFSASIISLVSWLWCLPSTAHLLSSTEQPQSRQWMPKCPEFLLVNVFLCSRRRSLRHLPVWPMYSFPQETGKEYTTFSVQGTKVFLRFFLQPTVVIGGVFTFLHKLRSLLGAGKMTSKYTRLAIFLCPWEKKIKIWHNDGFLCFVSLLLLSAYVVPAFVDELFGHWC